jgi:hypothetical protein
LTGKTTLLSIQSIDALENVRHYEIMSVFRRLRAQGMKPLEHMLDAGEMGVLDVGVALTTALKQSMKASQIKSVGQVCRSLWLGRSTPEMTSLTIQAKSESIALRDQRTVATSQNLPLLTRVG